MSQYFGDVLAKAMSRREVLRTALFGSAGLALMACGGGGLVEAPPSQSPSGLTTASVFNSFETIYPNTEDRITLPEGFDHNVVIRWGDPLDNGPALNWNSIYSLGPNDSDVERQKKCFGYNCDFVGFFRLQGNRYLLVVNHEYTNPELMFMNFSPSATRPTRQEAMLMLEAHGVSVVEIKQNNNGSWEYVKGSPYNRRITGSSRCEISGPARGHRLMKTSYDSNGEFVYGTLNNCAAGKTPWGTVLTCEENFHSYFGGNRNNISGEDAQLIRQIHQRYGVPSSSSLAYGFFRYDTRFNVEIEPREAFRFGWVVEIDPQNPNRPPIKRTALGRFKHEAATTVIAPGGKAVVYMGDDERFEYVYKFITKERYNPSNREANFGLLDEGELYVAKFNEDLSGEWILIARCEKNPDGSYRIEPNPNLPQAFIEDPVLCFINTRAAADALGATKMDRPEDFEWNNVTKSVWLALTYNERRGQGTNPPSDAANPRNNNVMGHILEIMEDRNDPTSLTFRWSIPVLCGDPNSSDPNRQLIIYGQAASASVPAISAPDNFAFDQQGNVWIATDGNDSSSRLGKNDGVYVLNPFKNELKMFLSGVKGCEICGPEFSHNYKTFFCAIQHPGEGGRGGSVSKWPYDYPDPSDPRNVQVPRPSVIAVWKRDGRGISV